MRKGRGDMSHERPASSWKWPRDAYIILAVVIIGGWLLMKWQATAMQWSQHGCAKHPYVLALLHGEPEWHQYCKQERDAVGDQSPDPPSVTPPTPTETGPSEEELHAKAQADITRAEQNIEESEEEITELRRQIATSEADIAKYKEDIKGHERRLQGHLEEGDADLIQGDIELSQGDIELAEGDIESAEADIAVEEEAITGYRSVIREAKKILSTPTDSHTT